MYLSGVFFCGFEGVKRALATSALDGSVFVHGNVCLERCAGMNICVCTCTRMWVAGELVVVCASQACVPHLNHRGSTN